MITTTSVNELHVWLWKPDHLEGKVFSEEENYYYFQK